MKQLIRIHNNLFTSLKNLNYKKIDRFNVINKNSKKYYNKKKLFTNIEEMSILINNSIYKKINVSYNTNNYILYDFDIDLGLDFPSSRFN